MHSRLLVQKMFAENATTTKFIEKYYSDRVGYPIRISLDLHGSSSYFNRPDIMISVSNLMEFADYNPKLFRPLFYTLMLHEIGHAIYTHNLPYSMIANVLEDNRLEYQISKWNTRVQFNLMRHIYQDEKLRDIDHNRLLTDKVAISLALMRTIQPKKFIQMLGFTLERKKIINEILSLNNEYMRYDYELQHCGHQERDKLISIITKVDELIDKLVQLANQEKQQKQQKQQQQQQQQSQEQEQEQQQSQEQEQEQEQQQDDSGDEEQGSINQSGGSDEDDNSKVQKELSELMQLAEKMQTDDHYDIPVLYNQNQDTTRYTEYKIGLFDTARHSGIKNTSTMQSSRGNIKQLNMQRYMRRGIVKGEKLFDRVSDSGRGGANAKVCFYLDISGSMDDDNKIKIATDYLKSFYDTMHKRIEIRMFGFGRYTYKITRNELNLNFIRQELEGATRLTPVKHKPQEKIIVITDGVIDNNLPEHIERTAQFVIIEGNYTPRQQQNFREYSKRYVHRTFVNTEELVNGLEQATKSIKGALLK